MGIRKPDQAGKQHADTHAAESCYICFIPLHKEYITATLVFTQPATGLWLPRDRFFGDSIVCRRNATVTVVVCGIDVVLGVTSIGAEEEGWVIAGLGSIDAGGGGLSASSASTGSPPIQMKE